MPRTRSTGDQGYPYGSFFQRLPRSALLTFYFGVFLIFAPLPILIASRVNPPRPVGLTIFWLIYGGFIAVAWAMSRTVSNRLLPIAILLTLGMSLSWAFRWPAFLAIPMAPPGLDGAGIAVLLIGAYVIFVIFISGQGVQTLRMQAELDLAGRIHATLAPPIHLTTDQLEIFGRSDASAEMGGDLIDIVSHPDGSLTLFLGDVSGHGVKAGVVMGMVKSAIRMRLLTAPDTAPNALVPSGDLLTDLNRVVCQVGSPEMFVTFTCLHFDSTARIAEFALAGHLPLLRFSERAGPLKSIENRHMPLGISDDEAYTSGSAPCDSGDVFVLYTDGLTEAADASGDQLGQAGFERIVANHARLPLQQMFGAIIADVRAHSGASNQIDDQTLLLARVR